MGKVHFGCVEGIKCLLDSVVWLLYMSEDTQIFRLAKMKMLSSIKDCMYFILPAGLWESCDMESCDVKGNSRSQSLDC